jgi:hypothetical protein
MWDYVQRNYLQIKFRQTSFYILSVLETINVFGVNFFFQTSITLTLVSKSGIENTHVLFRNVALSICKAKYVRKFHCFVSSIFSTLTYFYRMS